MRRYYAPQKDMGPFFAIARLGVRHSPFSYGKSPGAELIQERRRVASLSFSYDTRFLVDALFGVFFLLIGNESTSFFATQPFLERFQIEKNVAPAR
ncbi:hypothetical protein KSP39_PZI010796 [Platanthera zijinensis]|uniref:Uncharacterized protein n=1 Tax=Platanthera zijinensis TaxID=2320716 RepID=A0AAP0G6F5_9ASPA